MNDLLHPDLQPFLYADPVLGHILKHPLLVAPLPDPAMNALYNGMYERKRQRLRQAEQERDWHGVIFYHERAYRLLALLHYREEMPEATFWKLVAAVYRESENIHECRTEWLEVLASALPHRDHLMTTKERQALAALPEMVTVYRGSHDREDSEDMGFSWTTAPGKARWYAVRFRQRGWVFTAEVARTDVLALFAGGDDELIVLPQAVRVIAAKAIAR